MNIPDEVIEQAAEAYFLASDKDIGFDATTWEVDADETTKEQFRWAAFQMAPVIAEWARIEALKEAAALVESHVASFALEDWDNDNLQAAAIRALAERKES